MKSLIIQKWPTNAYNIIIIFCHIWVIDKKVLLKDPIVLDCFGFFCQIWEGGGQILKISSWLEGLVIGHLECISWIGFRHSVQAKTFFLTWGHFIKWVELHSLGGGVQEYPATRWGSQVGPSTGPGPLILHKISFLHSGLRFLIRPTVRPQFTKIGGAKGVRKNFPKTFYCVFKVFGTSQNYLAKKFSDILALSGSKCTCVQMGSPIQVLTRPNVA